ncbi:ATP synthase F1 subunit gamma [Clostridium sp.]|uniref:ATP synthase F1 subunit gamma n=1 Tax=Clostridium sp. TaxID=1506 RepID=UPI002FCB6A57
MAATGLVNIKRRIKSVQNTKKITKAMGLVATSKLKKVRVKLNDNNNYFNAYKEIVDEVVPSLSSESIFITGNNSTKKLMIVMTSDIGLCGSYNGSVLSKTSEIIGEDKENYIVMMIGQRGRSLLRKYRYETVAEYVEVPDVPTIKESNTICRHALNLYLNGEIGEVHLVYTKFINQLRKNPISVQLLPLVSKPLKDGYNSEFDIEGDKEEFLDRLIAPYFNSLILNAMVNAKVSEQSYRMEAMEGATKNADEIIDKLNLKYNRIRQSAITQEISEIVGGAQAQK